MNSILRWTLWFVVQAVSGLDKAHWRLVQDKVLELEGRAIDNAIKRKEAAEFVKALAGSTTKNVLHFVVEAALWFVRSFGGKAP